MCCRFIVILCVALTLVGCAIDARSYRPAEGLTNDAQERAFAACSAAAAPILANSGGLMGRTEYNQSITDCMRAKGYTKL